MAFSGFYAEAAFTSNPTSDLTDFVAVIDLSTLPQAWWDEVDTTDGARGRASKDDGSTELPTFWDDLDNVGQTGFLWVKWSGERSSTTNQSIRVFPPKSGNVNYAVTATYGRNAVWSNAKAAWNFSQDPLGTAPQLTDLSGNSINGNAQGVIATGGSTSFSPGGIEDGHLGKAIKLQDDDLDHFSLTSPVTCDPGDSLSFYGKNYNNNSHTILGRSTSSSQYWIINPGVPEIRFRPGGADHAFSLTNITTGVYSHFGLSRNINGDANAYGNGVGATNNPIVIPEVVTFDQIGKRDNDVWMFDGWLDHLTIWNRELSSDYFSYEASNQNDPTTFFGAWSTGGVLASGKVKFNDINFSNGVVDWFALPSPTQGTLDNTWIEQTAISNGVASMTVLRDPLKDYLGVTRGMVQDFTGTLLSAPVGDVISTGLDLTGVNIEGANNNHYIFRAIGGSGSGTEVTVTGRNGGDITVTDASAFAAGTQFTLGRFVRGMSRIFPKD